MNSITNYLIEANLGLIFFSAVYFLLLHRETQFKVKRVYLLGAMLASVVFPLIEFQQAQPVIPSISSFVPVTYLPEVGGNEIVTTSAPAVNYWDVAMSLYAAVVGILLLLFCIRVGKLIRYLKSSSFAQEGKFRIIESSANHPTFSFFHYIFIGNAQELNEIEKQQIINHEKLHASRSHSLDLLICEVLKIFFWFNPIVYILKNQLISIHEFEADSQAVQDQDAYQYCELLARGSLASAGFYLTNHFYNSLTLKRILMINTKKTKMKSWKYMMLIPAFAAGLIIVSCQDQVISEIKEVAKSSTMVTNYPAEVNTQLKQLSIDNPGAEYIVIEVSKEGEEKLIEMPINSIGDGSEYKNVKFVNSISGGEKRSFVILAKGENTDRLGELTKTEDGIYTIANQSASPKNQAEFVKYIQRNIKYPSAARQQLIQGKVYVSFVVEMDGSITNTKVAHGISPECDEEALRIANGLTAWEPGKVNGKAVRQKMILPIEFILDGAPNVASNEIIELEGTPLKEVSITGYAPINPK